MEPPLAYRRAAVALDKLLGATPIQRAARGFNENNECLAALTADRFIVGIAGAFRCAIQEWPLPQVSVKQEFHEGRLVLELLAPGRRSVIRLVDEDSSRQLAQALHERLNPVPSITFTPYRGR